MKRLLFVRHIVPFLFLYSLMIIVTLLFDYLLHRLDLIFIGRYLGLAGIVTLLISFIYSLRKRKLIESGSPKKLLLLHEYLAWIGSVLILVHAGIHFNALLPWLATFMLLIVVASGLIGKYLLKDATDLVKQNQNYLTMTGMNEEDINKKLFFEMIMVDAMKKWRAVHLPISLMFAVFSLLHILTILFFN